VIIIVITIYGKNPVFHVMKPANSDALIGPIAENVMKLIAFLVQIIIMELAY
jgi:hypothetical protein